MAIFNETFLKYIFLEVKSNEFEGMADIKEGQTVGLYNNNGYHGYIFSGDSNKYTIDISNDRE